MVGVKSPQVHSIAYYTYIYNNYRGCALARTYGLYEILADDDFQRLNKKTLRMCSRIEDWIMSWYFASIPAIVNSMSIALKIPRHIKKMNSLMLISGRGSGKSELLNRLLCAQNPDYFVQLPRKMFEFELVNERNDYFQNKIFVHDDLIQAFTGVSTKQLQQLTNFWTSILEGDYSRYDKKLEDIRCMVLFGFATETADQHLTSMIEQTFSDRVPAMKVVQSDRMRRAILFNRDDQDIFNKTKKPPDVKLPLPVDPEEKIRVRFPNNKRINEQIRKYADELHIYDVQSSTRAQDYIKVFMMSNALLNNRKKVCKEDLMMYSLIHHYYIESGQDLGTERFVQYVLTKNKGISDKELLRKYGKTIKRSNYYKIKKVLKHKGLIK